MKEKPLEQLEQIRSLHRASGGRLLSFFNVGAESMSTSMLQAIVASLTASPAASPPDAPTPKASPSTPLTQTVAAATEAAATEAAATGAAATGAAATGAAATGAGATGGSPNPNSSPIPDAGAPLLLSRRSTLGDEGHEALSKALLLAVRWDRPEIAKPILAQIEARGSIQHAFARGTMQRALQAWGRYREI